VPISDNLLAILCCPVTKVGVVMLSPDKLARINMLIKQGIIRDVEGNIIDKPMGEALITNDDRTIYRIDDGIPIMLAGDGIPVSQVNK